MSRVALRCAAALAAFAGLAALLFHGMLPPHFPAAAAPPPGADPGPLIPQGTDPGLERAAGAALLAEVSRGPSWGEEALAAFAKDEEQAPSAGGAALTQLYAPMAFEASIQEGGVRLRWEAHPTNPVASVAYRLSRWAGEREGDLIAETSSLEYLDRVDCEGVVYHYRLRAVHRPAEGQGGGEARALPPHDSPPAAASVFLTRSSTWLAGAWDAEQGIALTLERPGRPASGPHWSRPGQEIGATGWSLQELTVAETMVRSETRRPRFDALGRRVIIDGQPADRTWETQTIRLLAKLRLTDPCGAPVSLEILLPENARGPTHPTAGAVEEG